MIGVGLNLSTHFSINPGPQNFYGNSLPSGVGTGFNVGAGGHGAGTQPAFSCGMLPCCPLRERQRG
jgi:hypothetical protein